MTITVNGEQRDVMPDTTLLGLLADLNLKPEMVLVQRNDDVIERHAYDGVALHEGDRLELVRFVAGG